MSLGLNELMLHNKHFGYYTSIPCRAYRIHNFPNYVSDRKALYLFIVVIISFLWRGMYWNINIAISSRVTLPWQNHGQ